MKKIILLIAILLLTNQIYSQIDKCNYDLAKVLPNDNGWGYNYDSLMIDLDIWRNSQFVIIDSFGTSVQNRALWQLTISGDPQSFNPQYRIAIHARTHPNEVYSFYTTRAIIGILTGDSELGEKLRNNAIFNIIPIYNPDGVELGYPRENANGVDLERDWDSTNPQPESAALKSLYLSYMNSDYPIAIMLNMHNASSNFIRYFVYHHENGTSAAYAQMEQDFISGVHSYWTNGIADWNEYISWTQSTPTYFPESWFWFNYGESVLALTYEDTRVSIYSDFKRAADALLRGINDYLMIAELSTEIDSESNELHGFELLSAFPNPFNASTNIRYSLDTESKVAIKIYDITGKVVSTLINTVQNQGWHTVRWDGTNQQEIPVPAGIYLCNLTVNSESKTNKLMLLR